jgi:NifB/MoaA-like Fe-S oxidoreductase
VPSRQHYGDCPQIEDGVGMVRTFTNQFESLMRSLSKTSKRLQKPHGTIMTGTLFAPVLQKMMSRLNETHGVDLKVVGVANEYFGGDVSVAGLLTGGDLIAAKDQVVGDFVVIPQVTLKSDEPVMLDGMRFEALQEQFNVPVVPCDFSRFSALVRNGFQNN